MKLLIIFLSLIVTFTIGNNVSDGESQANKIIDPVDVTGQFHEFINNLKATGTYDPYHFNFEAKYFNFKFLPPLQGYYSGLLSVVPKQMDMNHLFEIAFDIQFSEVVELKLIKYDFEGILGCNKMCGIGEVSIKMENVALKGKGKLKFQEVDGRRYVSIKHVTPDLSIKRLKFKITGYKNDEYSSAMLTNHLNNMAPIILKEKTPGLNEILSRNLVKISEGLKLIWEYECKM